MDRLIVVAHRSCCMELFRYRGRRKNLEEFGRIWKVMEWRMYNKLDNDIAFTNEGEIVSQLVATDSSRLHHSECPVISFISPVTVAS